MPRPQFSLKTLLWLMAVVAALLGGREWGIRCEQERQRRADERAAQMAFEAQRRAMIFEMNDLQLKLQETKRLSEELLRPSLKDNRYKGDVPRDVPW